MYWSSSGVRPSRAKSKSLVASCIASGGRSEMDFGAELPDWPLAGGGRWGSCVCGRPISLFVESKNMLLFRFLDASFAMCQAECSRCFLSDRH